MTLDQFPWLTAIVLLPLVASFLIPILPDKEGKTVRWYSATFQLAEKYTWIPQLGLSWAVSVDGISAPLVLLAGLVTTLSIFAAWQVNIKPRLFYFLMLVLYAAQIGVFVSQDLLLFFIMWEVELIPVYLLVSIWGGQKRQYAATKFLLYTAASSIFILVAGLAMALYGNNLTFDMAELALKDFPIALELPVYAGLLIAFGVKLAIFPLHTWLPDAHGEASSPVSMVLAGVLLKMGGYGLIRLNMGLLEHAHVYFAPVLAMLGVINIISGAMLQMLSHGLIASVLFFLAGVTYDRTHTMLMNEMGYIGKVMPKVFALFTVGALASLALPGMSGFASEIAIFVGMTSSDVYSSTFRTVTVFLAAVGVILTPIYLLSMLRQIFYASDANPTCDINPSCDISDISLKSQGNQEVVCFGTSCVLPSEADFSDARPREVFIAVCFLVPVIAIGAYPKMATNLYDATTTAINSQMRLAHEQVALIRNNETFAVQPTFPNLSEVQAKTVLATK